MKKLLIAALLVGATYAAYKSPWNKVAPANPCEGDWRKCADIADLINHYNGMTFAQTYCKKAAEDKARFGTPEWPWLAFQTYSADPKVLKSGVLTLFEDNAKFQNGFGAMAHARVTCTYDLAEKKAVLVLVDQK